MSALAIDTEQLSRRFGDLLAVNSLDLKIPEGQIYGFLGPNGCGKSTTIRMLTGLLQPSNGEVSVLGYRLPAEAEALRLKIGYMTQKFSLYHNLTVRENLEFVSQIYGFSRQNTKTRINELLKLYELSPRAKQMAGTMSGGQKQRLALAAATLHRPELLFLDEPTSAVDPENRREFWERLFDLCDQGTTILVSTHYMDEAERCHGLAILEQGCMRAEGSPQALMAAMNTEVIEVAGPNLRTLKQQLGHYSEVRSAAQLGTRLRVLLHNGLAEPQHWLQERVGAQYQLEAVRPNLEDVFVTCTGAQHDQ